MNKIKTLLATSLIFTGFISFAQDQPGSDYMGSSKDVGNMAKYLSSDKSNSFSVSLNSADSDESQRFKPSINLGIGLVGSTLYQQVDKDFEKGNNHSGYNFQPALFKIGYAHFDATLTSNLSVGFSLNMHTPAANKITDAFVKYQISPYFGVQLGRFKGAGNRGACETGAYDLNLNEFTYLSENQAADKGATDLRHYGIDLFGGNKWVKYSFFWHNNERDRTRYWTEMNDGTNASNNFFKFNSWDASLRIFPVQYLEVGGHFGRMSLAGMGDKSKNLASAFIYYEKPNDFYLKAEWGNYSKVYVQPDDKKAINNDDHSLYPFISYKKYGYNFTGGYYINPNIEIAARYEHFNHGGDTNFAYKTLDLYMAGITYRPFPESPRNKITLAYQHRAEGGGVKFKNDWIGLTYQCVLFAKIAAK